MAAITIWIELEAPDQMLGKDLTAHVAVALSKLQRKNIVVSEIQYFRTKALKAYLARLG